MIEPSDEHRWLHRFVGEWTYEASAVSQPGEPPFSYTGTENNRSIGGIWVVCEGRGAMPDGTTTVSMMTLGYDPARSRYVGTFVGSMMTDLWIYDGEVDAAGTALTLETEGPSFTTPGKTGRYRDRMAFLSDDERVMTSSYQEDGGAWTEFWTSHHRRVR